jgi:hypothetical protein
MRVMAGAFSLLIAVSKKRWREYFPSRAKNFFQTDEVAAGQNCAAHFD